MDKEIDFHLISSLYYTDQTFQKFINLKLCNLMFCKEIFIDKMHFTWLLTGHFVIFLYSTHCSNWIRGHGKLLHSSHGVHNNKHLLTGENLQPFRMKSPKSTLCILLKGWCFFIFYCTFTLCWKIKIIAISVSHSILIAK